MRVREGGVEVGVGVDVDGLVPAHEVPLNARVCILDHCLQRVYFGLDLLQLLTIFSISVHCQLNLNPTLHM